MEIIKKISQKLGLSDQETFQKLGLSEDAKRTQILNALDTYAIFETKEELENYIKTKLSNKEQEIETLKSTLSEFETTKELYSKLIEENKLAKENIKLIVDNTIDTMNFKGKVNKEKIELNNLDFANLKTSILKQASELGWEVKEETPEPTQSKEPQQEFKAKYWGNGIIID
ncbi:hypothetical protein U5U50_01715 [Mycoplasma sp. 888]|uniref:hypothetical protein n=1 Tax=unclassified Mycoplasma TaxID=2683645 RepID=UPI002B1D4806|nr:MULTISPECIES: hypothetical protein [unclassified Mycoplasma]MEA4191253.1 hypothetical protein [Mycoplasma sp. 2248]WRQ25511.1 hypothetical protein U5U50_01715 [Mycoplasma sp. 888]